MRIWKRSLLGAFWVAVSAAAQPSAVFDSATVKRAAASTSAYIETPGRIHYASISVKALISRAYDSYSEIAGPGWMDSQLIEVDATVPPETTKEQSKQMLQNLIVEWFKLKFHVDKKDMNGYVLLVAKNGPKIKEMKEVTDPSFISEGTPGERTRMICKQVTMEELARALGRAVKSTVVDTTGLKAKYDFELSFAGHLDSGVIIASSQPPAMSSGGLSSPSSNDQLAVALPDIFNAVQSQLGLKLERKKMNVDVFVVDHIEKPQVAN